MSSEHLHSDDSREELRRLVAASEGGATACVDGEPLLCVAARTGVCEAMLIELLDAGAALETGGAEGGKKPLFLAAEGGHVEAVKLLLQRGADVESLDGTHMSALCAACENGHVAVVEALLHAGASVERISDKGWWPLSRASLGGYTPIVLLLLSHGADPNRKNQRQWTALLSAAKSGSADIVSILIDAGADVAAADVNGIKPFWIASRHGRTDVLKTLLKYGADVEALDGSNTSALATACVHGHVAAVEALLDAGASLEQVCDEGHFPLCEACEGGHTEVVSVLLRRGANPNYVSPEKWTALHCASFAGSVDAMKLLLDNGAHVQAVDEDNITALYLAANEGQLDAVKMLLRYGADVESRTRYNESALCVAARCGHVAVVELLLEAGAMIDHISYRGSWPLSAAVLQQNAEVVALLLRRGANAALTDVDKCTALHTAAMRGSAEIISLLIDGGAPVNAKDIRGVTPLQWACEECHLDAIDVLVSRGASVTIDVCLSAVEQGRFEVVRKLIPHIRLKAARGSILQSACACGQLKIVQFLLDELDVIRNRPDSLNGALVASFASNDFTLPQLLMDRGAVVCKDDMIAALRHATTSKSSAALEFLVEQMGANDVAQRFLREEALVSACLAGAEMPVRYLLTTKVDFITHASEWSPLAAAVCGNSVAVCKIMLDAIAAALEGATNIGDDFRASLFDRARCNGKMTDIFSINISVNMLKLLLEARHRLCSKPPNLIPALCCAVERMYVEAVRLIVAHISLPIPRLAHTCVANCAQHENATIVRFLLMVGFELDAEASSKVVNATQNMTTVDVVTALCEMKQMDSSAFCSSYDLSLRVSSTSKVQRVLLQTSCVNVTDECLL